MRIVLNKRTNPFDRLEDETYVSVDTENAPVNEAAEDISLEEKVLQFCSEPKGILRQSPASASSVCMFGR